jgi:hypothetical protein
MTFTKSTFLLALAVLCVACADAPYTPTPPRPSVRPDMALVYILRIGETATFRTGTVDIGVDGKNIVSIKDMGCTYLYLQPGPHQFRAAWPVMSKPLLEDGKFDPSTLPMTSAAGSTYYVNYVIVEDFKPDTFAERFSLIGKAFSKSHVISAGLLLQEPNVGQHNVDNCQFQPSKSK